MEAASLFTGTPRLKLLAENLNRIAQTDVMVIFGGETGTGKRVWAEYIHKQSRRADRIFHSVNITSLTTTLIESELFGVARGIYTGQSVNRDGHIFAANNGTLFLDEIGDLSMDAQTKMLHVFDEANVTPVGSTRSRPINIRFIFATKHDIRSLIEEGKFREDLYYRILTEYIHLPSLRENPDEIPALTDYILDRWRRKLHRRFKLTQTALDRLTTHTWPGNIRELEKAIERTVMAATSSELSESDFVLGKNGANIVPLADHLDTERSRYVKKAVALCGGDRGQAAKRLGVGINVIQKIVGCIA
jgi:transcriptional regulator with PAS, ATPase and Fis domain